MKWGISYYSALGRYILKRILADFWPGFWPGFLTRFLARFLARFLTMFLTRFLARFLARVLTRNTVYSSTGTEKYSVQFFQDIKIQGKHRKSRKIHDKSKNPRYQTETSTFIYLERVDCTARDGRTGPSPDHPGRTDGQKKLVTNNCLLYLLYFTDKLIEKHSFTCVLLCFAYFKTRNT